MIVVTWKTLYLRWNVYSLLRLLHIIIICLSQMWRFGECENKCQAKLCVWCECIKCIGDERYGGWERQREKEREWERGRNREWEREREGSERERGGRGETKREGEEEGGGGEVKKKGIGGRERYGKRVNETIRKEMKKKMNRRVTFEEAKKQCQRLLGRNERTANG